MFELVFRYRESFQIHFLHDLNQGGSFASAIELMTG